MDYFQLQWPNCGEERYLDGEIPKKRFKYLPLASRVKRYFNNASMSKLFQDHIMITQSDDVNDMEAVVLSKWYFWRKHSWSSVEPMP